MPAASALRLLDHCEWALVLSIEDLPYAWTTHEDLAGQDVFGDGRTVLQGLHAPNYGMGIDPHADWQFQRVKTRITLDDFGGQLAQMLSTFDGSEEPLFPSITPTTDLTSRTELHSRHVGNEYIDSSGGRNTYEAVSGFSRPRLHVGEDFELSEVAPVPVSELPIVLDGRRVVLYRMYRDHVTYPSTTGYSTWRPLSEADRCWWGTLRKAGHDVEGRRWTLQCDGPESWVYKRLGRLSQSFKARVNVPLSLKTDAGNDESRVFLRFTSINESGTLSEYGIDAFASQITGETTAAVRGEVSADISNAAAAAGTAGVFTAFYGHNVGYDTNEGTIWLRIDDIAAPNRRTAFLEIALHEKVWKQLGYDPEVQAAINYGDEYHVPFQRLETDAPDGTAVPGAGYWLARLHTRSPDSPLLGEDVDYANEGNQRLWKALYPGGTMTLPVDLSEPVEVQFLEDAVHHFGQLDRPPKADPDDSSSAYPLGGGVNRQGLFAITGPRRHKSQDESFTETQVIHASWREAGLDLAAIHGDPPTVVINRYERPKDLGINRGTLASDWVALQNDSENTLYAYPLLRLGYGAVDGEDQAHIVLQRLLYSTGQSAGWSGYEGGGATQAATSNEPAGASGGARLDGEGPDLCCQVPEDMIQDPDTWESAADRLSDTLRKHSLAIRPNMETETIMRGIMTPRGWGWSLDGGQYGLLDFSAVTTPEGATVLNHSRKVGYQDKDKDIKRHKSPQQIRAFTPKDQYVLKYDWNPLTQEFRREATMASPDRGARYRPYPEDRETGSRLQGASTHIAEAHGMHNEGGWRPRMAKVARWYDRGQFWLKGYRITRVPGFDIWPGTKVAISEPRAVNPAGAYGVSGAAGIVTRVEFRKGGREIIADILVDALASNSLRFNAPSARARGYDASSRQLHVDDDHLNAGGSLVDANYFVEPSWSNLGGDAEIQVHQWDGNDWTITATGTVESVDTTPGACTITIASPGLTGTYRRDDDAIITLRPMPNQTAAWVLAFFSPICDQSGHWNTPDEDGYKWA